MYQQRLVRHAGFEAGDQTSNRLRLVAGGLEGRYELTAV